MPERVLSEQEYNAVVQRVMQSAPPNMDEPTFNRWIAGQVPAAVHEAELQQPAQQGGATGRFVSNAAAMLNPIEMVKGAYNAVTSPLETGKAIVGASVDQGRQALDMARQGRYSEAIGHAGGMLPVVGPMAAQIGQQIGSGDIAGGLGAATGAIAPMGIAPAMRAARAAPGAQKVADAAGRASTKRMVDALAPKIGRNRDRFGTMMEKVAPTLARDPELGALSRESFTQKIGLKFEDAKAALDEAADARNAYKPIETEPLAKELEAAADALVAKPIEGSRLTPDVTPPASAAGSVPAAPSGPSPVVGSGALSAVDASAPARAASKSALFSEYLTDAKRQGYPGSPTALRKIFNQRLDDARELHAELTSLQAEYGPTALLEAIAQKGGIGMDKGYPGEIAWLRESTQQATVARRVGKGALSRTSAHTRRTGNVAGVPNVIKYGTDGRSLDDLAMSIGRDDPRFAHIQGPNDLLNAVQEAMAAINKGVDAPSFESTLEAAGIRKGKKWWDDPDDVPFDPAEIEASAPAAAAAVPTASKQGVPIGQSVVPPAFQKQYDYLQKAIADIRSLGPVAHYDALKTLRQGWDQDAKKIYTKDFVADYLTDRSVGQAAAKAAGVTRDVLAKADPGTAKANAEYHLYKTANDVLEAANSTERVRPRELRKTAARLGGGLTGYGQGGTLGALVGAVLAPILDGVVASGYTTKIATARELAKLEDFLRKGQTRAARKSLAKIAVISGQIQRVIDAQREQESR